MSLGTTFCWSVVGYWLLHHFGWGQQNGGRNNNNFLLIISSSSSREKEATGHEVSSLTHSQSSQQQQQSIRTHTPDPTISATTTGPWNTLKYDVMKNEKMGRFWEGPEQFTWVRRKKREWGKERGNLELFWNGKTFFRGKKRRKPHSPPSCAYGPPKLNGWGSCSCQFCYGFLSPA